MLRPANFRLFTAAVVSALCPVLPALSQETLDDAKRLNDQIVQLY